MKAAHCIEPVVYLLLIVLSLAILLLVAASPPGFLDTSIVYQGF